jgi:hypothetical protein
LGLSGGYAAGTANGTITWEVTNLGSADASGVLFIEHLPAAVKIQSIVTSPSGFCAQSPAFANSTRLACGLNNLPHGQSWIISVSVVTSAASAKTAAQVMFKGTDPVAANNYYLVVMQNSVSAASAGGGSGGIGIGSGVPLRRTGFLDEPMPLDAARDRVPDQ